MNKKIRGYKIRAWKILIHPYYYNSKYLYLSLYMADIPIGTLERSRQTKATA